MRASVENKNKNKTETERGGRGKSEGTASDGKELHDPSQPRTLHEHKDVAKRRVVGVDR